MKLDFEQFNWTRHNLRLAVDLVDNLKIKYANGQISREVFEDLQKIAAKLADVDYELFGLITGGNNDDQE